MIGRCGCRNPKGHEQKAEAQGTLPWSCPSEGAVRRPEAMSPRLPVAQRECAFKVPQGVNSLCCPPSLIQLQVPAGNSILCRTLKDGSAQRAHG